MGNSYCNAFVETLFSYETPKIVQIRSRVVGVISRTVQLIIISYIVGYVIVYRKGYQQFSDVESAETTKVKGIAFTNFSDDDFNTHVKHPEWYKRIWDVADYVVPPSENGGVFIATNIIITPNQTQGVCPEDPEIAGAKCDPKNPNCPVGEYLPTGNGVMTGNCINVSTNSDKYSCEIKAWCPVETDVLPLKNKVPLLKASENFTILVKNFVSFPKFAKSNRRNIKDSANSSYLQSCHYDPDLARDCPIFRLGDIVNWSGQMFDTVAYKGAVIGMTIKWDCNFDFSKNDCYPTYSFNRLDDPEVKLAPGWNFRTAHYYDDNRRTLYKLHGILLSIHVVGQAGKFHIIPLLLNVGAGLGLLALQIVICDIVVLYLLEKRNYFKSKKYEEVDPESDTKSLVTNNEDTTVEIENYERLED